jgi:hypothetical protein
MCKLRWISMFILIVLSSAAAREPLPTAPGAALASTQHYEYVIPDDGFFYVYDMDNSHQLVKRRPIPIGPNNGIAARGVCACPQTHMLYISYGNVVGGHPGYYEAGGGFLLKYDLLSEQVLWTKTYSFGIDSMDITPDGKTIYMPTGEIPSNSTWEIIDAATGNHTGTIPVGAGPHNTIVSRNGAHVYMGTRYNNHLWVANTSNNQVFREIGPLRDFCRPFTINGTETLAFITVSNFLGFQIGSITSGQVLYTVPVNGFNANLSLSDTPSHGISLSPDEREIYLIDDHNSYLHVYDVSGLPGSAPRQVADIPLNIPPHGTGWVQHSRDGRFVYVGDGGHVIDTRTRQSVAFLDTLLHTREHLEIDWQNGVPIFATPREGLGYVTGSTGDFAPSVSLTSPSNGATFTAPASITLSATASDPDESVSKVDFFEGSTFLGTATSAPYKFTWSNIPAGSYTLTARATDAAGSATTSGSVSISVQGSGPPPKGLAISCGGSAAGNWVADTDFSGGNVSVGTTNSIDTSGVTNPAPQEVYQHHRFGDCTYTIPGLVAGAPYTVRLHFAELFDTGAGQRLFDVVLQGSAILTRFDIFAAAGGQDKAVVREFTTTADGNGHLTIVFTGVLQPATISGIEVISGGLAISCGGTAAGNWIADTDFSGGSVSAGTTSPIDTSGVTNPAPQEVYQHHRFGNCTYTIPDLSTTASYTVRLHFAELFSTAAGQRLFNVAINGGQVLSNFDIFAAAGGQDKAVVRQFTTRADGNGHLTITFSDVVQTATISGIEVFDPPSASPTTSSALGAPSSSGATSACGLTGLETVLVLGLLALRRRQA